MRRDERFIVFLTVVLGLGLLASGRDQANTGKPDFTGNWELNVEQSKFGQATAPTRMTLRAALKGNAFHAVQTRYDQSGGPDTVEGDWFLDGKWRPLGSDGKMTGMSRWDGDTLVNERKSADGTYDEVIRMTLSANGKRATESISLKSPNGDNKSSLIWDKK